MSSVRSMNGINNIEVNEVEFPDGSTITSAQNLVQLDTNNNFTSNNTFNVNLPTSDVNPDLIHINNNTMLNKHSADKLYIGNDEISECFNGASITGRDITLTRIDGENEEVISIPETSLSTCVLKTGTQTIDDVKTFTSFPVKSGTTLTDLTPTADGQLTPKKYLDHKLGVIDTIIDEIRDNVYDDAEITTANNVNTLTLKRPDGGSGGNTALTLPQTDLTSVNSAIATNTTNIATNTTNIATNTTNIATNTTNIATNTTNIATNTTNIATNTTAISNLVEATNSSFDTASYTAPILKLTNIVGTEEDITIDGFGDAILTGGVSRADPQIFTAFNKYYIRPFADIIPYPPAPTPANPAADGDFIMKRDGDLLYLPITNSGVAFLDGNNTFGSGQGLGSNSFNPRPTTTLTNSITSGMFITKYDAENQLDSITTSGDIQANGTITGGSIQTGRFGLIGVGYWARMNIKTGSPSITRLYIDPENLSKPLAVYINGYLQADVIRVTGGGVSTTGTTYINNYGVYYQGSSGVGTANGIAIKWRSSNSSIICRIDNTTDIVIGQASDRRVKRNIKSITPEISRKFLDIIKPRSYNSATYDVSGNIPNRYLPDFDISGCSDISGVIPDVRISCECDDTIYGGVAQEIEEHFPELVNSPEDDGIKSLKTESIVFMTISSLQLIDKNVKELNERIAILEDKINNM